MNLYHRSGEKLSTEDLRFQLGALLVRSPDQQQHFYELFDAYVLTYTHQPVVENPPPPEPWYRRYIGWMLLIALGLIGVGIWAVFFQEIPCEEQMRGVRATFYAQGRQKQALSFNLETPSRKWWQEPFTYDSVVWDLGDGQQLIGSAISHTYTAPGKYPVQYRLMGNACNQTRDTMVVVQPNIRLEPAFSYTQQGDSYAFSDISYVYEPTDSLSPDTLIETNYFWDFGDGKLGKGRNVSHTYSRPDAYTVELRVVGVWTDTTVELTYRQTLQSGPRLRLARMEVEDEDISDLLRKEQQAQFWRWFWGGILLLYLLYELWRAYRRKNPTR